MNKNGIKIGIIVICLLGAAAAVYFSMSGDSGTAATGVTGQDPNRAPAEGEEEIPEDTAEVPGGLKKAPF